MCTYVTRQHTCDILTVILGLESLPSRPQATRATFQLRNLCHCIIRIGGGWGSNMPTLFVTPSLVDSNDDGASHNAPYLEFHIL